MLTKRNSTTWALRFCLSLQMQHRLRIPRISVLDTQLQSTPSWLTILKKREAFRRAFDNFQPDVIVQYGPEKVEALLETMKVFPEIRFSVKMRLGGQDAEEWKALVPLLNRSCVTQVTLHPRIGKQQYKGTVDWEAFRAFYEACERPLVYNGDLLTVADIREVLEAFPRLKGVMLGRGLLANPALALAFREGELSENELKARVAQMHRQMYLYYHRVIEGGEAQLLAKLKTCWEYLLPELDKKQRKAILKSNRLDGYLRAVEEALR